MSSKQQRHHCTASGGYSEDSILIEQQQQQGAALAECIAHAAACERGCKTSFHHAELNFFH
jgi:hypothetical protein